MNISQLGTKYHQPFWDTDPFDVKEEDILMYYDGPVIFLASRNKKERYLFVAQKNEGSKQCWLATPVSAIQEKELRSQKDQPLIRKYFITPGALLVVTENRKSGEVATYQVLTELVPSSCFPKV